MKYSSRLSFLIVESRQMININKKIIIKSMVIRDTSSISIGILSPRPEESDGEKFNCRSYE